MQEQNANTANKLQFIIRLNLIKNAKGWEIPDFAEAIGATIPKMANYLTGKTDLPIEYLAILSEKHGIDVGWLVTGVGQMYNLQSTTHSEPLFNQAGKPISDMAIMIDLVILGFQTQIDELKERVDRIEFKIT